MNLRGFVSQVLLEVSGGVFDANDHLNEGDQNEDGKMSPFFRLEPTNRTATNQGGGPGISFDVAVTTREQHGVAGKAGLGIEVLGARGEAGGSRSDVQEYASRIQFTVAIVGGLWRSPRGAQ